MRDFTGVLEHQQLAKDNQTKLGTGWSNIGTGALSGVFYSLFINDWNNGSAISLVFGGAVPMVFYLFSMISSASF